MVVILSDLCPLGYAIHNSRQAYFTGFSYAASRGFVIVHVQRCGCWFSKFFHGTSRISVLEPQLWPRARDAVGVHVTKRQWSLRTFPRADVTNRGTRQDSLVKWTYG